VSVLVRPGEAEDARARMVELFPEGFEESEATDGLTLAAYTDADGEERLRGAFGVVESVPVEADWADRWREFHRSVRAGPFWVGPPWERPPADALAIVIDPGRAFGTGAHPTTRLCLEFLAELPPASALDVGSGSGVLAIAAAKRGFSPVIALDSDPAAVDATRANAARNEVAVEARRSDALAELLPYADVALANLTLMDVQALAPRLSSRWLIASGYLVSDRPSLAPFRRRHRRTAEGWAADVFEHGN
jgi:ribosomal protein L11 methyltransferase